MVGDRTVGSTILAFDSSGDVMRNLRIDDGKDRPIRVAERVAIRMMDVLLASLALLVLLPVLISIGAIVFVTNPGPIFFRHRRIGRAGSSFNCLKFRSMVVDADARLRHLLETDAAARLEWERDHKLEKDPRVTPIGRLLRVSSLDELPQLLNVLRGEMSLVGPRPIVEAEIGRYGRYIHHYFSVSPGITGLWQVSGRSTTSYRRRVAFDVTFARSYNIRLYARIIVMTVPAVLLARGSR